MWTELSCFLVTCHSPTLPLWKFLLANSWSTSGTGEEPKWDTVTLLIYVSPSKLCGIIASHRQNHVGSIHGSVATNISHRWVIGGTLCDSASRTGCKEQFGWGLSQPGQGNSDKLSSCSLQTRLQWTGSLLDTGWQVQDMSWRNSGLDRQYALYSYRLSPDLLSWETAVFWKSRGRNCFLSQDFLLQMFAAGTCSAVLPPREHRNNPHNRVSVFITSLSLNAKIWCSCQKRLVDLLKCEWRESWPYRNQSRPLTLGVSQMNEAISIRQCIFLLQNNFC